ncbi:MAG: 4-vinyl reductase [Treponema sp.]|nr:4-vinyl reductase [Treponema sp.]
MMENVFKKFNEQKNFTWGNLGNIKEGRNNLGEEMPVLVYRLMQFTLVDVLTKGLGKEKTDEYMRAAGLLAGLEFARNVLDLSVDLNSFIASLQKALEELKVGILRIESIGEKVEEIILTVAEDLDCSGLPITEETVCNYDEGFIAGILEAYTGRAYHVREIDCWASGDRVCRFKCTVAA